MFSSSWLRKWWTKPRAKGPGGRAARAFGQRLNGWKTAACSGPASSTRPSAWAASSRQVGFKEVEVLHKHGCFAAFGGIR
jgi:hypothetical protein